MPATKTVQIAPGKFKPVSKINQKDKKLIAFIQKNCSQYLALVNKTSRVLYRGVSDNYSSAFIGHPRSDREPKDSDQNAHEYVNQVLSILKLPTRANSIFCSSNVKTADEYGELYLIFPVNGSKYMWNPKHRDLILHDHNKMFRPFTSFIPTLVITNLKLVISMFRSEEKKLKNDFSTRDLDFNYCKDGLKNIQYDLSDFKKYQEKEILVDLIDNINKEIKLINNYQKKYKSLLSSKLLVDVLKIIIKAQNAKITRAQALKINAEWNFTDQNISKAFASGYEICVQGTYIAVNLEEYAESFNKLLFNNKIKELKNY